MVQNNNRKNLSQQTAEQLAELIQAGEFKPGDRLPNEIELFGRFHVSRTTLREAIRMLSVRGFLDVRHGSGTFVCDEINGKFDEYGFQDLKHIRMNVKDLYEARLIFEPQVASMAVIRATDEEMATILDIEKQIERSYEKGEDLSEYDRQFHNAIVKCAHNPFLEEIINIVNEAIKSLFILINYNEVQDMVAEDHRYITNFLVRRDPVGVKSAMKVHILHGIQLFEEPSETIFSLE